MHENPVDAVSDIVVFMTAYRFQKMAFRGRRLFMGKKHVQKELSSHHIDAVFSEDVVVSQLGRLDFKASFDSLMQKTNVVFPNGETKKDSHNDIWTQMEWAFTLKNNMSVLFDADILQPSLFYKLKPFKVVLKDRTFTVHSIAYMLSEGI